MKTLYTICILLISIGLFAQETSSDEDAFYVRKIYDTALTEGRCYSWLEHLTTKIGGRLAGSPQAAAAVTYAEQMLDTLQLDDVRLQPCMVPHWVRGEKEQVRIVNSNTMGSLDLRALSLGNSIGTGEEGLTAEVIEVQGLQELEELGAAKLKGKIVFFNRPMDPKQIRTFNAYGGAADQRVYGPTEAAKYGAVAALVRSLTTRIDDFPHTGVTVYRDENQKIPALAISTKASEQLSGLLKKEKIRVYIRNTAQSFPDKPSYNVIGEIKGSTHPDEIILIGGHLDSWDVGQGAHDDGAGCVQSMDVLQILKRLNYKPKRTIRCVLFMNEENGLGGGKAYAKASNEAGEYHLAALESDSGGFTPRGFRSDGEDEIFKEKFKKVTEWLPLLEPYGLSFSTGGSGADISPLKSQKGLLFGFKPDSQRYFDYHHTEIDTFDKVNQRELELGAAAMTSLVFLIDKYGL
ncbi:MAG: M20/M25/M40 family metallo-hydrolase [Saprospiraceae bacterium]